MRSEEWRRKQSDGIKRAHAEGKMSHVRDPEFLARRALVMSAKFTGHKLSDDHREKISKANTGKTLSPERVAAMKARKLTAEQLAAASIRLSKAREKLKSNEVQERRRKSISIALTGTHGFGRGARGRPDHCQAKYWVVRSPFGVVFEFSNAMEWCRSNAHLFNDDKPESKLPIWKRAFLGFSEMGGNRGELCSWKGWTLVSVRELNADGADLLGRDESELLLSPPPEKRDEREHGE